MSHEQGRIESGDVRIFYRRFGKPGASPILLFHGGNYYDSVDWIEVATALSQDREVVVFDARGFGESGWSPSKDYSHAAHMADDEGHQSHPYKHLSDEGQSAALFTVAPDQCREPLAAKDRTGP